MSCCIRKPTICIAKIKRQIDCALIAQLICHFVFATGIVQFFFYLVQKFKASSLLLSIYRPLYVRPVQKPKLLVFLWGISNHSMFQVQMDVDVKFVQDQLKGDNVTEIRLKFIKRLEDAVPVGED